jgi:hypothetical protein
MHHYDIILIVDMATARQHAMEIRKKLAGRKFTDSVELIREDREK